MIREYNISPQSVSWVKSNKKELERKHSISNLYYPETIGEFVSLLNELSGSNQSFEIIGYSSNTLFLPSYRIDNLICTKRLINYSCTNSLILCECGVNVAKLSKEMVSIGVQGFEGLTDLPGTIGAAVYGNCGCRGCSVNSLVEYFTLLTPDGNILKLTTDQLKLTYRSSALKRGELKGVILEVALRKKLGNKEELERKMAFNHEFRKMNQPTAANNLGTTINGGKEYTLKGRIYWILESVIKLFPNYRDSRKSFPALLRLIGKSEFVPYVYTWNRYMFLDAKAHFIFSSYVSFIESLYKDARLEIEIRS